MSRSTPSALVLSAGGMFGAYQAGVWAAVSEFWQPDIVVGASVGSLNGWAIAGGCPPDVLLRRWLDLDARDATRFRMPRHPFDGVLGSDYVELWAQELVRDFSPQIPLGVVLTDLIRVKPVLFRTPELDWQHLAGSCAVLGLLRQQRIGGAWYSDGGLLNALPLWAAEEMGATALIGVNVMPRMPLPIRGSVEILRKIRPGRRSSGATPRLVLTPSQPLGGARAGAVHSRENTERWIQMGMNETRARRNEIEAVLEAAEAQRVAS